MDRFGWEEMATGRAHYILLAIFSVFSLVFLAFMLYLSLETSHLFRC